jgi:hypothetical protein
VFLLISRLTRLLGSRLHGGRLPLLVIVLVFGTSWLAMDLVEPADSEITAPGNYWWYFVVTAATVGYGDLFPVSGAGRLVGTYVIVGGIVTLTLLFTRLADHLQSVRSKRTSSSWGTCPAAPSGCWPSCTRRTRHRSRSARGTTCWRTRCPRTRWCPSCAATSPGPT